MPDLRKLLQCLAADPLRGRVGSDEFGMLGFKLLELLHQHIIFVVGDDGCILDIVQPVVVFKLPSQSNYFLLYVHNYFSTLKYVSGTFPTITVSATRTSVRTVALSVPHGISTSTSITTSR